MKKVSELADILQIDGYMLAATMAGLGVEINAQGEFDPQAFVGTIKALHRASDSGTKALLPGIREAVRLEMGTSAESCRTWLQRRFEKEGIRVKNRIGKGGALFVVMPPNGGEMMIGTSIALQTKGNPKQIGFTASVFATVNCSWHIFVAQPWGRAFVRNLDEVLWRTDATGKQHRRRGVTFSLGVEKDLFENRIQEITKEKHRERH